MFRVLVATNICFSSSLHNRRKVKPFVSAMATIHRLISFEDRERIANVQYEEKGTYREMLKEPRPEDVRRYLREDTSLLLVFLSRRIVVFLSRALATADTRVTRVTCNSKKRAKVITCRLGN